MKRVTIGLALFFVGCLGMIAAAEIQLPPHYHARVHKIIDNDTIEFRIQISTSQSEFVTIDLYGLVANQTPEAREWLTEWFNDNRSDPVTGKPMKNPLYISVLPKEGGGLEGAVVPYSLDFFTVTSDQLNTQMIADGHAVSDGREPYNGTQWRD
jgi:hypothetical protein